ncbi:MAG: hypothetical protein H0V45_07180 [Actinobacteria bacterium]|nr:hypothetical protein [Actinomycetota bacterium]
MRPWATRSSTQPTSNGGLGGKAIAGTLTIHMGADDEPERQELATGSVLVVQPGTALQLSNRHDDELRLFIVGAPAERGETVFLPTVE